METLPFGTVKRLPGVSYEDAIEQVTEALKSEGFGILTEIDVKATLKKKLDVDFRPYVILGACNPPLAHKALTAQGQIGLLMPCNAVVQKDDDGVVVSIADPRMMAQFSDAPDLAEVAEDAHQRILRVLESL